VSLEIRTTPADSDPHAIRIARHLADNLGAAGIDARVSTVAEAELYRQVLINHDFDLYVGQYPEGEPPTPDALFPLLHSGYTSEPGWQNPFGFTDLEVDDLLESQRRTAGGRRRRVVVDLQEAIARATPFVTVAFPDELTAVRQDRFRTRSAMRPISPLGLLDVRRQEGAEPTMRLTTTDERITENRNPIAAEYRRHGTFTGLLYDPLVYEYGEDLLPWLAGDWEWLNGTTLELSLRDVAWHDGEPLSAADVAFTYDFLADTSMGRAESPIPASRFRGQSSLVADASAVGEAVVQLTFEDASREVARRALTVPVLPRHVWREFTGPATVAGIEVDRETTEALVWNNPEPVGSGPLRFREATPEESVVLERNPEHFLADEPAGIPSRFDGSPEFDRLELRVAPSDIAAVQRVGDGLADATTSNLGPDSVPRIGREADARLVSTRSGAFYHVGFNTRRGPLSNPRFRTTVARHVDESWLVSDTFQGYARPAATPLALTDWAAPALAWDGEDPAAPFLGTGGELDVTAARDAFREIGYRYNEDGELLASGG